MKSNCALAYDDTAREIDATTGTNRPVVGDRGVRKRLLIPRERQDSAASLRRVTRYGAVRYRHRQVGSVLSDAAAAFCCRVSRNRAALHGQGAFIHDAAAVAGGGIVQN